MGRALIAAARRGRDPDHAARRLLPARRLRRAAGRSPASASATATPRRGRTASTCSPPIPRGWSAPPSTASARSIPAACATVAEWAAGRERPLHAHVSEQPAENEACLAAPRQVRRRRSSPTPARSGPRFTAVHATHLTDADIGLLGDSGCCCCLCPTTERDLADGDRPGAGARRRRRLAVPRLRLPRGDRHARGGPGGRARRAPRERRARSPRRARRCCARRRATATPALGRDGGRLEAGAPADLVTIGLDSVRLAGAPADAALDAVVFAASAADVREVVCGGRAIVSEGRHVDIDVAAELRAAIARGVRMTRLRDRLDRPAGHQRPGARRGAARGRARRRAW